MEKVLLIGERGGIGSAIKMLLKNDYELFIKNRKDEDEANYKI